eukprot:7383451-Prymnesium_polylepis.1
MEGSHAITPQSQLRIRFARRSLSPRASSRSVSTCARLGQGWLKHTPSVRSARAPTHTRTTVQLPVACPL